MVMEQDTSGSVQEGLQQMGLVCSVLTCAWFVQEHQLRATQQRQRDRQAPLHATRVGSAALLCSSCELYLLQQVCTLCGHLHNKGIK